LLKPQKVLILFLKKIQPESFFLFSNWFSLAVTCEINDDDCHSVNKTNYKSDQEKKRIKINQKSYLKNSSRLALAKNFYLAFFFFFSR
jgi:hypothetical protein